MNKTAFIVHSDYASEMCRRCVGLVTFFLVARLPQEMEVRVDAISDAVTCLLRGQDLPDRSTFLKWNDRSGDKVQVHFSSIAVQVSSEY